MTTRLNTVACSFAAFAVLIAFSGCEKESEERTQDPGSCEASPGALFEQRVAPLLVADRPSTCSQCHAGGLALEQFVRGDACESMACMKLEGLVNLESPEQSVILSWIERAEPESELITEEVIAEEYEAFLSWIEHEAECGNCAEVTCGDREFNECERLDDLGEVYTRETDPGDCDRETLEKVFRGTLYAERDRCSPCHFAEEEKAAPTAPRYFHRTGECNVASLASLTTIEASGYIDVDDPFQSLLIQKPLAEFQGGLEHGGHDKFVMGDDDAYNAFMYFLTRYGACMTGSEFVDPTLDAFVDPDESDSGGAGGAEQ